VKVNLFRGGGVKLLNRGKFKGMGGGGEKSKFFSFKGRGPGYTNEST